MAKKQGCCENARGLLAVAAEWYRAQTASSLNFVKAEYAQHKTYGSESHKPKLATVASCCSGPPDKFAACEAKRKQSGAKSCPNANSDKSICTRATATRTKAGKSKGSKKASGSVLNLEAVQSKMYIALYHEVWCGRKLRAEARYTKAIQTEVAMARNPSDLVGPLMKQVEMLRTKLLKLEGAAKGKAFERNSKRDVKLKQLASSEAELAYLTSADQTIRKAVAKLRFEISTRNLMDGKKDRINKEVVSKIGAGNPRFVCATNQKGVKDPYKTSVFSRHSCLKKDFIQCPQAQPQHKMNVCIGKLKGQTTAKAKLQQEVASGVCKNADGKFSEQFAPDMLPVVFLNKCVYMKGTGGEKGLKKECDFSADLKKDCEKTCTGKGTDQLTDKYKLKFRVKRHALGSWPTKCAFYKWRDDMEGTKKWCDKYKVECRKACRLC